MATVELTAENFQDVIGGADLALVDFWACLLYTSPSPRDRG